MKPSITRQLWHMPANPEQYSQCVRPSAERRRFSIIIPTWNNLDMLKWCVAAVRKNSAFKHQIILHINDGSDGTFDWARSQPDIDYTHSPQNIGICYAMNLAAGLAATDYIVYLNDDMWLCPAWDKHFDDAIQQIGHTFFFISAMLVEPKNEGAPTNFGRVPADFDEQAFLRYFEAMPKCCLTGACNPPNIVHRNVWNMVGGYSVEFSPGFESDHDFVLKLWQLGVRHFCTIGAAVAYHVHEATSQRVRQPTSRDTLVTKWGFPHYSVRYFVPFGIPANPENAVSPLNIPRSRRILNKLKYLHCAMRYVFMRRY